MSNGLLTSQMTYSSGEECRVATMPIGDQGKHVTAILRLTGFEEVPTEPSGSVQLSASTYLHRVPC